MGVWVADGKRLLGSGGLSSGLDSAILLLLDLRFLVLKPRDLPFSK